MEFIVKEQPMICGSYNAEIRKYHKYTGESGDIWLVADQPNSADNIYHCNNDPKSQGFAGRTLKFQLIDGSTIELKGPWHSNSDALFECTGVDIRNKHLTFVVIGMDRQYGQHGECIISQVIYQDKEPIIGYFNRGTTLAKEWANKLHKPVVLYSQSTGGSSLGMVCPDG